MSQQPKLTLDQKRAKYAWEKANEAAKVDIEKYTNLAKAVPSLIMNSGLMQTFAFLNAKDEQIHTILLNNLTKWLGIRFMSIAENAPPPHFELLMAGLYNSDSSTYMQATNETMALLRWIRQFADARKAMEKNA
jgi:CRISPR-associated protein Cmr5